MMPIYIPTAGRPDTVATRTLAQIPEHMLGMTWIVCPAKDMDAYTRRLKVQKERGLRFIHEHGPGIAGIRRQIGEHAQETGARKFFMLDDDLKFFRHKADGDFHLEATSESSFTKMVKEVSLYLEDYAHVSISSREGNNRYGVGPAPLPIYNTRALRALAFQTKPFLECEHGRVLVMEDFDVQLQLLRKGFPNVVFAYWAHDQQMTNAKGGCSTYRTHEVQEASARKLADLHPGCVTLRQKENKTDRGGFGTRTEVTVYWKKALNMGVN